MYRIALYSPHLCVAFLFLNLYPAASASSSSARLRLHHLCHTPSFTHIFVTHHLCHTPSFTHHLSHTTLSHTIFHTQLCHTPSFTHINVTHHHTSLSHTTLSHTIFHTQLCHTGTWSHALWHFAWQAWHLETSTFVLRGRRRAWSHPPSFCGRRGTYGTGLALVAHLGRF